MSKRSRTKGLVDRLRIYVLSLAHKDYIDRLIRKEKVAEKYGVRQHEAHEALVQLNKEGLISQARHTHCWDGGIQKSKCWHPDYYVVRRIKGEGDEED